MRMYKLSDVQWKLPKDVKPWEVVTVRPENEFYADVVPSMWTLSPELTSKFKEISPTSRDYAQLLRHELPGCIELSSKPMIGRGVWDTIDPERVWHREKLYMIAYVDHESWVQGNVDAVRTACFDAVRLLAKRLKESHDKVREVLTPPAGASVDYRYAIPRMQAFSTSVLFIAGEPIHYVSQCYNDGAYVGFDPCSDRIAIRMASYFCVVPA